MWYLDGDVFSSTGSIPTSPDIGQGPFSPISPAQTQVGPPLQTGSPANIFEETSHQYFNLGNLSDPDAFGKLWKLFQERQKIEELRENERGSDSWEMIVLQGVLLTVLVLISILWAFCCKKRCYSVDSIDSFSGSVAALARKLSNASHRDLPPSYSKVDLRSVGLTIDDHFNPPPSYDWALEDTLMYCNPPPSPTPGHSRRFSRFSHQSSGSDFSSILSRKDSNTSILSRGNSRTSILSRGNSRTSILSNSSTSSRRTSRVTFAPDLEMGPTPSVMRGDSNMSLPIMSAIAPHSARRKSIKSEGYASSNTSRRVSFADEYLPKRKRSSIVEIDPKVEEELRLRLSLLGRFDSFEPIIDGILSEGEEDVESGMPTGMEMNGYRSFSPPPTLEIINEAESD